MIRQNPFHRPLRVGIAIASIAVSLLAIGSATAKSYDDAEVAALLPALEQSRLSLADGVRQLAKGEESAVSAKFELNDDKQLSLSVYTAEKGLAVDAEHNVLKEFAGDPRQLPWKPEAEVFKDIPHVARASEHLTLMSQTRMPLAQLIGTAQKEHKGRVFSAIPAVEDGRGVLVVLIAAGDKVEEFAYDLRTGRQVAHGPGK
ncbi:MAG: hypothetical protein K2Y35_16755 [Burkholderiales bacterium]|nr:hypothetical protein [Burkholderiales bacterium]